jgi:hypothetical protein
MIPITKPEMNRLLSREVPLLCDATIQFCARKFPATNSKAIVPINARLLMTIGSACINIFPTN